MTAILPPQIFPLVDRPDLLPAQAWYEFFRRLTPLSGSAAYNPPNIAASGTTTTTVTVTKAALGQPAWAAFSLDLQGLVLTAYVSAADTVTVVLFNPTALAINLSAGTLTAWAGQS